MAEERPIEYCCHCSTPTEKAGRGEDSIYLDAIGVGPLCEKCYDALIKELEDCGALESLGPLKDAVEEFLTVATLRGDGDLPPPCDDPKLWTARMADAWTGLEEAFSEAGGEIDLEAGRKQERQALGLESGG